MVNSPCVIIATDQRLSITTINIKLLLAQEVKIILIVSDLVEKKYFENFDIHVLFHHNHPLGGKFQHGVEYARQFNPSHLVILGSDDLLSKDFFEKYCTLEDACIGFKDWYIWNQNKLYLCNYKPAQPLGGGRVYPNNSLNDRNWKLFDVNKAKHLDDYAYRTGNWFIKYEPEILAVKGDWVVMNPVDLNHRNVKLISSYVGQEALKIMKERFNYEP